MNSYIINNFEKTITVVIKPKVSHHIITVIRYLITVQLLLCVI